MPASLHVVLDTDTYNEVDDQFALAHLLLSPEVIRLEAVYAAPFFNPRSSGPSDGMEKSYEEINRLLDLAGPARVPPVFRGSTSYLPDARSPVQSDVVNDLVDRALAVKSGKLHVLAIGAATNIASALLAEPAIAEKIVIVWLGGHGAEWPHTREFNLEQDLHAARVLLDTDVPLVLLPCHPVTSHLITTPSELDAFLAPHSKLGEYLAKIVREYGHNRRGWSKVIWDIAASAWAINTDWVKTRTGPSPVLRDDLTWQAPTPAGRREIDIAFAVDRDAIFSDFFAKCRSGLQPLSR